MEVESRPTGALISGIKRAQESPLSGARSFPAARTHRTIYLNGRPTLPDDPATSRRDSNSLPLPYEKAFPADAPIMPWQKALSLPWLIGSTYLFLRIIYDIYGKYIDRSIYRSEDEHAFPFLLNYLGIESIQSHQSSMQCTQADGTANIRRSFFTIEFTTTTNHYCFMLSI